VRDLNHLKLAYTAGRPLAAKGYLRIQHRWRLVRRR